VIHAGAALAVGDGGGPFVVIVDGRRPRTGPAMPAGRAFGSSAPTAAEHYLRHRPAAPLPPGT